MRETIQFRLRMDEVSSSNRPGSRSSAFNLSLNSQSTSFEYRSSHGQIAQHYHLRTRSINLQRSRGHLASSWSTYEKRYFQSFEQSSSVSHFTDLSSSSTPLLVTAATAAGQDVQGIMDTHRAVSTISSGPPSLNTMPVTDRSVSTEFLHLTIC